MSVLKEAIRKLASDPMQPPQVVVGKVRSVDWNEKTCVVEVEEGYDRLDVRLLATEGDSPNAFVMKPKVGSEVLVEMVEDNPAMTYVLAFTEVDELWLRGDAFGGLVKLAEVEHNLDELKVYVEALKAATQAAITAVGVGTAANGPTASSGTFEPAMAIQSINFQNMENPNVKHG